MKKTIDLRGEKIILEFRACAVPGCESHFWAKEDSKQSICGGECYAIVLGKPASKLIMPDVRLAGQKSRSRGPKEKGKKGPENIRAYINSDWKLAVAKKKHNDKLRSKPRLHLVSERAH